MTVQDKIIEAIKKYNRIIIHRHQSPDPDALGSQGGLAEIIRASYPEKEVLLAGGEVGDLDFLVTMDDVTPEMYQGSLVIVTDTANAPRISGENYDLGDQLIKIDHHPDDSPYGDLSWVNTEASSCSEIIYDFYDLFKSELVLTTEAARLLYAGIVGDTGRFMYPATTAHTLQVAAYLRQLDFDAPLLNRQISEMPYKVAKLSGYVLQNLEMTEEGAARIILPHSVLEENNVTDADTSALISLPGQIDTVVSWGIFVEQPTGNYRVRLRSKGPIINEIAKNHDGGGHPLASGAKAKDLSEVDAIFSEIKLAVVNYK
ncbi:bifunctional oligoribonuclease/PAP phosphatase NrnA [Vagococcus coleopterorum]|uniref:Bifunctional oligoribonuclease/PAP phosphatase NrnA n=1 Tax=Vagococcus coleopterorum TaxID=2714946 RepID=A0A6G8AKZ5_9ENTE|nr:bifunctional oligoribonuclease/PAP phosphatase NrnA [Vagococcus coleopterorum]QIL45741.1 bifunctional oligoribonuclease/PAP phosphatase NrnA [Vagococcus coleopterorum]